MIKGTVMLIIVVIHLGGLDFFGLSVTPCVSKEGWYYFEEFYLARWEGEREKVSCGNQRVEKGKVLKNFFSKFSKLKTDGGNMSIFLLLILYFTLDLVL